MIKVICDKCGCELKPQDFNLQDVYELISVKYLVQCTGARKFGFGIQLCPECQEKMNKLLQKNVEDFLGFDSIKVMENNEENEE